MVWRYVEGRSGSRANPPRYGVCPSCSPQRRRCCHDDSASNAGPWRRLHDDPERAWAGFGPSDGGCTRDSGEPGARSAGRVGRGVRPVGSVASAGFGGRHPGTGGAGHALSASAGPLRPCAEPRTYRRLHRPWHAPGQHRPVGGDPDSPALAVYPAAGGTGAGHTCLGVQADAPGRGRNRSGRRSPTSTSHAGIPHGCPGQAPRAAGGTALPHHPTVGRAAENRGGEL